MILRHFSPALICCETELSGETAMDYIERYIIIIISLYAKTSFLAQMRAKISKIRMKQHFLQPNVDIKSEVRPPLIT